MAKFRTPFLSDEGVDFSNGTRHCAACEEPLHRNHLIHKDHVLATWSHFAFQDLPEVLATDESGKTIEGVIAVPARRVLALVPIETSLQYCLECFPSINPTGCAGCGEPVDQNGEHTMFETLVRKSNGINYGFTQGAWHIKCLPSEFTEVIKAISRVVSSE